MSKAKLLLLRMYGLVSNHAWLTYWYNLFSPPLNWTKPLILSSCYSKKQPFCDLGLCIFTRIFLMFQSSVAAANYDKSNIKSFLDLFKGGRGRLVMHH